MANKVKLKKKKSASQQPEETPREFALNNIDLVEDTEVLPADEEEVTTLDNVRLLRSGLILDERSYRSALMRMEDNAGGFNNLPEEIQDELARTFATDAINVVAKYPDFWDRVRNGCKDFHKKQVQAREKRFRWCASVIYNACTPTAAATIIGKMIQNGFWVLYVEFGVESLADDGIPSLFDYVLSTAGTPYDNAGLLEDSNGQMNAGTITNVEMVERITDCLKLGKFYKLNK